MRLTSSGDPDIQPDLNSDATLVAYASRSSDYEIRVMNADGSGDTALTNNATDDANPDWSPDGSRIAFQAYRDGQSEIYVMQADGSAQTRLTNHAAHDGMPAWSPDGTRIVFTSNRSGVYLLWTMNADGSQPTPLSSQPYSFNANWSPDGNLIAYDADGNGDGWQELWVMQANGTNAHLAYTPYSQNTDAWAGAWSPDGRYISVSQITYALYGGNWYWTSAFLRAYNAVDNYMYSPLHSSATAWNPDWRSRDNLAPNASIMPLPSVSASPINLRWGGVDLGPAGIRTYDIQVRLGASGSWSDWYSQTTATTAEYPGVGGQTYAFRIRAIDVAGNQQNWTTETETTVESLAPVSSVRAVQFSEDPAIVSWSGYDPGGSGIATFDVQQRTAPDGPWVFVLPNANIDWWPFYGLPGTTGDFRVRARDRAGNVEPWPADGEYARVTYYTWRTSGRVVDATGAPVVSPTISVLPAPLGTVVGSLAGDYGVYGVADTESYAIEFAKPGYGSVPTTTISGTTYGNLTVVLPPTDSVVRDGTFESAGLSPTDWQSMGALPSSVSSLVHHTGEQSLWLGAEASSSWAPIDTAARIRYAYGYTLSNRDPAIAVDHDGIVHAVWISNPPSDVDGYVWYVSRAPGGTWTEPVRLSDGPSLGPVAIAVDAQDRVHVAWTGQPNLYRVKVPGQTWSPIETVPGPYGRELDLAVDSAGDAHVVFVTPGDQDFAFDGVAYTHRGSGNWSAPMGLITSASMPSLAVDPQGSVHVLAIRSEGEGISRLLYVSRSTTGTWSAPSLISDSAAYMPDLASDESGNLHAVWTTAPDGLGVRFRPAGGSWGAEARVAAGRAAFGPQVAGSGGHTHVFYRDYVQGTNSSQLAYLGRFTGAEWSEPVFLTPPNFGMEEAGLALGANGQPYAIWSIYLGAAGIEHFRDVQVLTTLPALVNGQAIRAQPLTIPVDMTAPRLALHYQLGGTVASPGNRLRVRLQTAAGIVELADLGDDTTSWTLKTFDVSAWAGQSITLTLQLDQVAGFVQPWAWIDDVALGSTHPDVWTSLSPASVHPGEIVTYRLAYGNQGGAAADGVSLSFSLPPGFALIDTSIPASQSGRVLSWSIGHLDGKSSPPPITIVARAPNDATVPSTIAHPVHIETSTTEIEVENNDILAETTVPWWYLLSLPVLQR